MDLATALVVAAEHGRRVPADSDDLVTGRYFATADETPTYADLGRMIADAFEAKRFRARRMPLFVIRTIANVSQVGVYELETYFGGRIRLLADFAFVVDTDGFTIFDVSTPLDMKIVNRIDVNSQYFVTDVCLLDSYAYITGEDGLYVYDLSDLLGPEEIGVYSINGECGWTSGTFLHIATETGHLNVIQTR